MQEKLIESEIAMMPRIGEKDDPMFILCPNIGEHPTQVLKCTETWDFWGAIHPLS